MEYFKAIINIITDTMIIFEDLLKDQNIAEEILIPDGTPQILIDWEQVSRACKSDL